MIIVFKGLPIDYQTKWEEVRPKVIDSDAFKAFENESDCQKVFEVRHLITLIHLAQIIKYIYFFKLSRITFMRWTKHVVTTTTQLKRLRKIKSIKNEPPHLMGRDLGPWLVTFYFSILVNSIFHLN